MISYADDKFTWKGGKETAIKAGWAWDNDARAWKTSSRFLAMNLREYLPEDLFQEEDHLASLVPASNLAIPRLLPFQNVGVALIRERFEKRTAVALFDEQGLGKTIQAIQLIRPEDKNVLIVCPASLRLNWEYELQRWLTEFRDINVLLTGADKFKKVGINIVSYDLLTRYQGTRFPPDLMILDESHYLKNISAARTKAALTLAKQAKRALLLSGTPLPNGRPIELYPVLKTLAPESIDNMPYHRFEQRFQKVQIDRMGYKIFLGPKNSKEFKTRLLGSGFMVRRIKKDVLKDLPDKIHKLVVLEADSKVRKILEKEKGFSVQEILDRGPGFISGLPEIRREMAVASAPVCIEYLREVLEGGLNKLVVMAHHRELIAALEVGLDHYHPVVITGSTPPAKRFDNVNSFQKNPDCRVFIGNLIAAGTGITLTVANEICLVEPDWVPGVNNQAIDRVHRIGQERGVIVHYLAVKESLTFKILKRHLEKTEDIKKVIGE